MPIQHTRRQFLAKTSAGLAAGASIGFFTSAAPAQSKSPNERLNAGIVGVAGRGGDNMRGVAELANIAALCDIDDRNLSRAAAEHGKAAKYHDFRKLLDDKSLDAIVVSTADHTHAFATVGALKAGKHVYCEKPLTHTVHEARVVAQTAAAAKVATQMGTQIHATDNYRRVVELVHAGAIGPVTEVFAWVPRAWDAGDRPKETHEVPPHLHWDLWIGPAPYRPFHTSYIPENWRRWWEFGNGTLGDMGCHLIDLVFWSLDLRHPTSVSAEGPPPHPEGAPSGVSATWQFASRGDKPAVTLRWSDGNRIPREVHGQEVPGFGVMFVGERGMLFADYGRHTLYPEDKFQDYQRPPKTIPASVGHHREWVEACKTGATTSCNFDYAGALTEAVLLGVVAYRSGEKFTWDAKTLKTSSDKANAFLQTDYRPGWTL
jgi:predicted dehydrogenase